MLQANHALSSRRRPESGVAVAAAPLGSGLRRSDEFDPSTHFTMTAC